MTQLVLFVLVLLAVLGIRRFLSNTPLARFSPTQQSLIALGVLLLMLLALTGRLGVLVPVLGAVLAALFATLSRILPLLIPLIVQYLSHWQRQRTAHRDHPGDDDTGSTSTVQSDFLRMHLHHNTGELSGEILQGPHAGESLKNLSLSDLASLYRIYTRRDPESARLLAAYIERVHGDRWRESEQADAGPSGGLKLDKAEALELLGLQLGATREEIIAAHRRLIQKLHPDRGGSDYLAAKINQAKDALLGA